jgi:hypothetical protein
MTPTREELVRRRAMRTFTARVAGSGVLGTINTADVAAYGALVDGRYQSTDAAIGAWLTKKYGPSVLVYGKNEAGVSIYTVNGDLLDISDYSFVKSWKDTYRRWYAFWQETLPKTLLPIEAGSVYDDIAAYDATVKQFQTQLVSRGGVVYISPDVPKNADGSTANPLSTIDGEPALDHRRLGLERRLDRRHRRPRLPRARLRRSALPRRRRSDSKLVPRAEGDVMLVSFFRFDPVRDAVVRGRCASCTASVGASSVDTTARDVIYLAGFGLVLYVSLAYIIPIFIGAATHTKRAHRSYKESGRHSTPRDNHGVFLNPKRHVVAKATFDDPDLVAYEPATKHREVRAAYDAEMTKHR